MAIEAIRVVRNLRAEANVKPSQTVSVIFQSDSEAERAVLTRAQDYISRLAKVESLSIVPKLEEDPKQVAAGVVGTVQVLMPLAGLVDIDALKAKLQKDLGKIEGEMKGINGRLGNPNFVNRAPAEVVEANRQSLAELQTQAEILTERLNKL